MTYSFKKAVRENAPLLMGIAGGTGSGKTLSALRVARGLVGSEGRILMVNTERGRGTFYADDYDYQIENLAPPFSPDRYLEILKGAEATGAGCIIVDSMSHVWDGPGGCLEWANETAHKMAEKAQRSPADFSFASWKEPKQAHQRLVNWLIQSKCHVIICMRAKEKLGYAKNEKTGKREIVELGLTPVTEGDLPYEMAWLAMLSADQPGVPTFTFKALTYKFEKMFPTGRQLSEEHGRLLAEWANGGAAPAPRAATTNGNGDVMAAARTAAARGTAAFREWWKGATRDQRAVVNPQRADMQKIAEEADKAGGDLDSDDPFTKPADAPGPEQGASEAGAAHNRATAGSTPAPASTVLVLRYDERDVEEFPDTTEGAATWLDRLGLGMQAAPAMWQLNRPSAVAIAQKYPHLVTVVEKMRQRQQHAPATDPLEVRAAG